MVKCTGRRLIVYSVLLTLVSVTVFQIFPVSLEITLPVPTSNRDLWERAT